MGYISKQGIENLAKYRYTGVDKSIMVRLFLRRHWDWICATFVPMWLAPNLITLAGLILCVFSTVVLVFYAPGGIGADVPDWVFLLIAFTMYMYQVLDNVDGRQARRTGNSSALGELFDHGVDSIVCFLFSIWIANVHLASNGWQMFFTVWAAALPWFLAHWEELHTGILVLGQVGNPTEAQWMTILMTLSRYFFGTAAYMAADAWLVETTGYQWFGLNFAVALVVWLLAAPMNLLNMVQVIRHSKNMVHSILVLMPVTLCTGFSSLWFYLSSKDLMNRYPVVCNMFICLMFSYIVNRMLISRITQTTFNVWNPIFLLPGAGLLNVFFPLVPELLFFWTIVGITFAVYCHFVFSVIAQLCDALGINALTIPFGKGKKD